MNNIQITKMTDLDLKTISNCLEKDFDDFWNPNILKEEFNNPNSTYIIAKSDSEIVGFAGIWQAVDVIHITNIITKKDKRNFGIGSLLLSELINLTKNKKIDSITLEVKESNLPAIKLYEKFDFKNLGIRKNYYNNCENAIIMTKTLTNV